MIIFEIFFRISYGVIVLVEVYLFNPPYCLVVS